MFDEYRNRISKRYGSYMGETMRKQSDFVVDSIWMNSISTRPVQVKVIDTGLPPTYNSPGEFDSPLWAHFEENTKFQIAKDEIDYYLFFRPHERLNHPEIKVGSYVAIPDADNMVSWWIIMHIDYDHELCKCNILKTTRVFKWIRDGKIYEVLACGRNAQSYNAGVYIQDRTDQVDNVYSIWMPTNSDSLMLGYNQRLIISDKKRMPPLVWVVSRIDDQVPDGITKFKLMQEPFDPHHDNAELGLANYYDSPIEPAPLDSQETFDTAAITYSGTQPTIKVGGSFKTFKAAFTGEGVVADHWTISDENGNITTDMSDYIVEYDENNNLKLKIARNYNLIGKVLIIQVIGSDGSTAEVSVEVV